MTPEILHLHTYILFPFSIDKQAVLEVHAEIWERHPHWIEGLDEWMTAHGSRPDAPVIERLGRWQRSAYSQFDMDSPAYQDMVFFHPFVRRVFFDTIQTPTVAGEKEALLRCYTIPIPEGSRLWFEGRDQKGRGAKVEVTDLRLFMFANGIGILSIGIEALRLSATEALWINESLRKVYPSSGRQLRESRSCNRMAFILERGGQEETIAEERFETGEIKGFHPPLARTLTALLYFANYDRLEIEPVLDERMIVYTYAALDPATFPPDYLHSEEYQELLSRFLYVDRAGSGYRYEPEFTRNQMQQHLYRRWAHQGTYYGFTSYSNITVALGNFDCDEHVLREGFLIHRMFTSRYYLMALVALFYRATLLDFAERTALVSKQLFLDMEDGRLTLDKMHLANQLRSEFLHFSNYWFFDELANKDEETEHFEMQCRGYHIASKKAEVEEEIEKLDALLHSFSQLRNTEAVNRLAMLSLIFGAGAVLTGFFGMNFGRDFAKVFFEPEPPFLATHYTALLVVAFLALGALAFGFYVVISNWSDYKEILTPRSPHSARRKGSGKQG
ncbi:MAG: hypothetical protein HY508_15925 [Acidobacteria bacterium]|nr:hypothetical protein [Acidobacteriota bacterium]